MVYKIKTAILKNKFIKSIYYFLKRKKKDQPDIKVSLIKKYVSNKSFIDVGCMWGVNGFFSFLAEELGAKEVVAFDIYPTTEEFNRLKHDRNSNVKYVRGDINSKESMNILGKFDVVYCTGLLYHVPDPLYTLSRLKDISKDVLILGTHVIPELNNIQNTAVFYPYLSEKQRDIWNLHQGSQLAITESFDPSQGYGNWMWGFSSSCLESMIKTIGFDIIEKHLGRFYSFIVCKVSDKPFLSVSGDWTEPDYTELISRYKF
jgi:SAM-dependent methyltransferase